MKRLVAAAFALAIAGVTGAHAQALTPLNGTVLTGSPPTGFASQPFEYFCTAGQALCWPQIQLWDGTTQATVNSGDNGLTVHVANSVGVTGTFFQATQPVSAASLPLPTGAATQTTLASILSALGSPTQASGSTIGISGTLPAFAATPTVNLGTIGTASTSALQTTGNTALTTINTTLGSPMQNSGGTVTVAQATATSLKSQVSVASGGIASGAVASGAYASGSFVAGALADGAVATIGTEADTAWSGTGSGTEIAILKKIAGAGASSAITGWGGGTLGAMANYGTSPGAVLVPGVNAFVTNTNANGQATAANSSPVVLPAAQVTVDPCALNAKTNLPISTNATSLTQIIAASGSTKIYICSIVLVAPAATAFNLNTGTGTNCGTSTAALIGSLTPGNGMSLAANGGITLGNGSGTIAVTAASSELCTLQSTAVQVAGNLTYVQQ